MVLVALRQIDIYIFLCLPDLGLVESCRILYEVYK